MWTNKENILVKIAAQCTWSSVPLQITMFKFCELLYIAISTPMQGLQNRLLQSTYQKVLHEINTFTWSLDNGTGGTCSSSVVYKLCPTNLLGNWCRPYTLSSASGNATQRTYANNYCYFCFYPTLKRDKRLKLCLNTVRHSCNIKVPCRAKKF